MEENISKQTAPDEQCNNRRNRHQLPSQFCGNIRQEKNNNFFNKKKSIIEKIRFLSNDFKICGYEFLHKKCNTILKSSKSEDFPHDYRYKN